MSTKRLQRVKVSATGVERGGGRVKQCVNLVRLRGALTPMTPIPSADDDSNGGKPSGGSETYERRTAVYAPVRLVARVAGRMQRQTSAFTPSEGDPGRRQGMGDKDVASLSDMLGTAYCGLVAEAAENGMMLQPVACGYRLIGADGSVLYESGVGFVGAREGAQLCGVFRPGLTRRSPTDFTIADFAIEAEAYALEAEIPAYGADSGVAEVEIYVGEQLHPVDPDGLSEVRIDGAEGNNPTVRLALPGATTALTPNLRSLTSKAMMLSGCGMGWMRVAARIKAGEARVVRVGDAARGDVAVSRRLSDRVAVQAEEAAKHTLTAEERLLSAVGTPCGFRAERCVRSGDTAVMSGITTVRFEGVSPLEMVVAGEGDDLIELRARVTGRDGAEVVREAVMRGDFSTIARSVVVGYPSGDMSELHIEAVCGGVSKHFDAMLVPSADMSRSLHVTAGLAAAAPERKEEVRGEGERGEDGREHEEKEHMDDSEERGSGAARGRERRVGNALVAVAGDRIAACLLGAGVEVADMALADRSRTTWDSSKCHLYATASDGIYGVSVDMASERIAATSLSGVRVTGSLIPAREGYYAATGSGVVAIAGGCVKAIGGGRWMSARIDPSSGLPLMTDVSGRSFLVDDDGTEYMADPARQGEAEWRAGVELEEGERVCGAELRLRASSFDGVVEIAAGGRRRMQTVSRWRIRGPIRGVLRLKGVVCPSRPYVELRLKGRVSADMRLRSATVDVVAGGGKCV